MTRSRPSQRFIKASFADDVLPDLSRWFAPNADLQLLRGALQRYRIAQVLLPLERQEQNDSTVHEQEFVAALDTLVVALEGPELVSSRLHASLVYVGAQQNLSTRNVGKQIAADLKHFRILVKRAEGLVAGYKNKGGRSRNDDRNELVRAIKANLDMNGLSVTHSLVAEVLHELAGVVLSDKAISAILNAR